MKPSAAGFQLTALASAPESTAVKAPPIASARAPTPTVRKSAPLVPGPPVMRLSAELAAARIRARRIGGGHLITAKVAEV